MKFERSAIFVLFRLLFIASFLLPGAAHAASPGSPSTPDADEDTWRTYTNANWINDLVLEGDVLWAASDGGLARWVREPASYTKYQTADGLPSTTITSIAIDSNGIKWIGTAKGLVRYDDVTFITYNTANSPLLSNAVNDIAIGGNGDIWICTSGGVNRLSGTTWTSYTTGNSGLAWNNVLSLAIEGGVLWFGTRGYGISRFDGATWTTYTPGTSSSRNTINAIAVDNSGVKWFGTGNPMGSSGGGLGGLFSFDNTTWTPYTESNSDLISNYVFSLAVDSSGAKWIGTESGLNRFDGSAWNTYTHSDGLAADWVSALVPAPGGVWAGTQGGGISLLSSGFHTYRTTDQLPHNTLFSMTAQGNNLWVSGGDPYVITPYSGLSKFDGVTWTHYRYGDSGISMPEVYDVEEAPGGQLWVVGWDINTFDGANLAAVTDPYADGIVKQVAVDGSVVWFYSYEPTGSRRWVSRYDGVSWTAFPAADIGLPLNTVRKLAVDQDHNVWLSTDAGVARFDGSSWTILNTSNSGLPSNNVYDIEIDEDGSLWFTSLAGVSRNQGSNWTTYNTSNSGLVSNWVYGAAIDRYGSKWFTTNYGINLLSGQTWSTYTRFNSGLADNAVYDTVHNVAITGNNHKWFYTPSGLSELYQPHLTLNYSSGAPGSYFNLVGSDFPPAASTGLFVNGLEMGTIVTNASGVFTATISTSAGNPGWYYLTTQVGLPGNALAPQETTEVKTVSLFVLDESANLHPRQGGYPLYSLPAGSAGTMPLFLPVLKR